MEEKKIEGLLLQVIPYLGTQKILKVFSREGVLSLMSKRKESPTPFMKVQVVFTCSGKEIHSLKDFSPQDPLDELKTEFRLIENAGKIAKAILKTQQGEGNHHAIYALTLSYFKKLPFFKNPETLLSSFYLKLLLHDGLLSLDPICSECERKGTYLGDLGTFCSIHQKGVALFFSGDEWEMMNTLTFARKFDTLQKVQLNLDFSSKIERLFENLIH